VLDITSWPGWAKTAALALAQFVPFFRAHYEARYEADGTTTEGLEALGATSVGQEGPRIMIRGLSRLEGVNICLASSYSMVGAPGIPGGRGFRPDELRHIERISKVDVQKYIRKHPDAPFEPPGGSHVVETQQLIRRLKRSVKTLNRVLPHLDEASSAIAREAILQGEQKLQRLISWLSK
jgi:hypothetical protein